MVATMICPECGHEAHTPGPWEYGAARNYVGFYVAPKGTLPTLASVERVGQGLQIECFNFHGHTEANALLISLSPELLAELKLVVSRFDYNPGHSDLDNEQPIHLPITLGDYRRINMLIHRAEGK